MLKASLSEKQVNIKLRNLLQAISNRVKNKNVTDVCIVDNRKQ